MIFNNRVTFTGSFLALLHTSLFILVENSIVMLPFHMQNWDKPAKSAPRPASRDRSFFVDELMNDDER